MYDVPCNESMIESMAPVNRELSKQALHEAYDELIEKSPIGIFIVQGTKYVYVNQRFAEMLGFAPEEIISRKTVNDLVAPESRPLVSGVFRRKLRHASQSVDYALKALRKDGRIIDIEALVTRTTFRGRHAVMGSVLDITERKAMERKKQEMEDQQREFFRRTILAATEGKLEITEFKTIRKKAGQPVAAWYLKRSEDLHTVRQAIATVALAEGMDKDRTDDFVLCAGEAATNAYKHAGGGEITLHVLEGNLMLLVTDRAGGIETLELPHVALSRGYSTTGTLGMGYKAMIALADRIYLATGPFGTTVAIEMSCLPATKPEEIYLNNLADSW